MMMKLILLTERWTVVLISVIVMLISVIVILIRVIVILIRVIVMSIRQSDMSIDMLIHCNDVQIVVKLVKSLSKSGITRIPANIAAISL